MRTLTADGTTAMRTDRCLSVLGAMSSSAAAETDVREGQADGPQLLLSHFFPPRSSRQFYRFLVSSQLQLLTAEPRCPVTADLSWDEACADKESIPQTTRDQTKETACALNVFSTDEYLAIIICTCLVLSYASTD